ncbi:hypothetical protein GCM10023152_30440 [Agromyces bauzanensis]|uniref:Uncharacterized protein n=1 Tax=Agromyces bauzanensis TaxID=1308924 RepID=A0A917PPX2_9MICO|nr:hypothetical protein GCM10011372_26110 [Agromyces bauzanensis]
MHDHEGGVELTGLRSLFVLLVCFGRDQHHSLLGQRPERTLAARDRRDQAPTPERGSRGAGTVAGAGAGAAAGAPVAANAACVEYQQGKVTRFQALVSGVDPGPPANCC